jgi:predicted kinase
MTPIYFIIGPPAVGKSTTSRALAARFTRSIHIPVDDLRNMVVAGLALPAAEWGDELTRQVTLARNAAIAMALAYREAGFAVVIDDFWDPNRLAEYRTLFDRPGVWPVLLWPERAEAHRRNLARSGDSPARAYIDEGIRTVYRELAEVVDALRSNGWLVLDTSALSIEEAVASILAATREGSLTAGTPEDGSVCT